VKVDGRALALGPAIVDARHPLVQDHQRTGGVRIGKHRRRAGQAAEIAADADPGGDPVRAQRLDAAQVHTFGKVLAALEVLQHDGAVDLIFVVVGNRRSRG
jgi:hypothetical protein